MGLCCRLLAWFINYLQDRHQRVVIRDQQSEIGKIKACLPQGSVLGPLLFLTYINDIAMFTRSSMILFADNAILYVEIDNQNGTSAILNDDLGNLQQWADQWLIKCSPSKNKADDMFF